MTDVNLWLLYSNTWNHLTICKKMSSGSFKNVITKMFTNHIYSCIKRIRHLITYNGWYAIKPSQPTFSPAMGKVVGHTWLTYLWRTTSLEEGKILTKIPCQWPVWQIKAHYSPCHREGLILAEQNIKNSRICFSTLVLKYFKRIKEFLIQFAT